MKWKGGSWMVGLSASMACLTGLAFLERGIPRNIYIAWYKSGRVREGSLVYRRHWGWVDLVHYHIAQARLEKLQQVLRKNRTTTPIVILEGRFRTAMGGWITLRKQYVIRSRQRTAEQQRAIGVAIVMEMAHAEESAQAQGRFWQGTDISAFQFDDLPSTWLACLESMQMVNRGETVAAPSPFFPSAVALSARHVEFMKDFPEQGPLLQRLEKRIKPVRHDWNVRDLAALGSAHTD